jgi:hypothetical protein
VAIQVKAHGLTLPYDIAGRESEDSADLQAEEQDQAADHACRQWEGLVLDAASQLLQPLCVLDEDAGLFHPAPRNVEVAGGELVALRPLQEHTDVPAVTLALGQPPVEQVLVEVS